MTELARQSGKAVPAVTRAVGILNLLRTADEPMSLSELSRPLKLVPSTCLHILRALTEEGLVAFDPATKRYRLGLGLLSFSAGVLRQNPFAKTVQPVLDRIGQQYRVTTFAIEKKSTDRLAVVAVSENLQTFSVRIVVGTSFPALASASGRCVAAHMQISDSQRRKLFEKLRWQNAPPYDDWVLEVEAVRTKGYGMDAGHFFRGTTIISVPIAGSMGPASRFLAAVCLTEQLTKSLVNRLAEALKAEAKAFAI